MSTSEFPDSKIFDVREIFSNKHQLIFDRFHGLAVGDFFVLRNGHNPVPLYYQFEELLPGCFSWEVLPPGPGYAQVKITKLKSGEATQVGDCGCGH